MRLVVVLLLFAMLSGCSTIYPLAGVAKRTEDARTLKSDVRVDTASRELSDVRSMAWAAYTVSFECERQCPYSVDERKRVAQEIADASFVALDREIRLALGGRTLQDPAATARLAAFANAAVRADSYQSRVGQWLTKLGLGRTPVVNVTARGLKAVNPSEIGWSGEESLMTLGRALAVDAVLVGHVRVTLDEDGKGFVILGPKLWLFSANKAKTVAVAELRPNWRLSRTAQGALDWNGLDPVASAFSRRISQALTE